MLKKVILVSMGVFLVTYVIIFTRYAPDFYVLIKYYVDKDYLVTPIYKSIIENTFITDLICWVSDFIDGTSIGLFGGLLLFVYILTFIFKYGFLFSVSKSISPVLWLFIASFFAFDCNQMRYNLSLLLLVISVQYKLPIPLCLSFLSHITSVGFRLASINSKWIYSGVVFIPFLLGEFADTRFIYYLTGEGFIFFKTYLLVIPIFLYNKYSDKNYPINIFIKNLSVRLLIISPFILIIVPLVTARLIETIFLLLFYGNIFVESHRYVKISMYVFAAVLLINRLMNSSIGEDSFIDSYDYSIW